MPSFDLRLPTTPFLLKTISRVIQSQPLLMPKQLSAIGGIVIISLLSACNTAPQTTEAPSGNESFDDDTSISALPTNNKKTNHSATGKDTDQAKPKADVNRSKKADNLWSRIRADYQLQHLSIPSEGQQRINDYIARYSRHPKSVLRQTKRAGLYLHYVVHELEKHKLPAELALLPFVESSYDPFAYSSGHAAGLWQFIPGTGTHFKLNKNWWIDERRDVVKSTAAAIKYFKYLNQHFDNDWLLAIAAYNAGEGTVGRAIRRNQQQGKPTDYWSLPLPKETVNYLPKLFAWSEMILNPDNYQLRLTDIKDRPYFASVNVGSQIELAKLATMADISIDDLYALNPAFNRWATDPDAPHDVLIPVSKADMLQAALSNYPMNERVQWQHYTIQSNDSLSVIASRFNTTVAVLKSANQLKSNRIRTGKTLLIPSASQLESYYSKRSQKPLIKHQKSTASGDKQHIEHFVKDGESLWSIAKQYKVSSSNIALWNNISEQEALRLSQRLVIRSKTPTSNNRTTTVSTSTPTEKSGAASELTYKVQSGDSLSTIADTFNVSVNKIQRWNKINPKKYIQPGQTLTLFVTKANETVKQR